MEAIDLWSESMSKLKLNCQVETGSGVFPFSSERVMPIWMTFKQSTFDFILKYSRCYIKFSAECMQYL